MVGLPGGKTPLVPIPAHPRQRNGKRRPAREMVLRRPFLQTYFAIILLGLVVYGLKMELVTRGRVFGVNLFWALARVRGNGSLSGDCVERNCGSKFGGVVSMNFLPGWVVLECALCFSAVLQLAS